MKDLIESLVNIIEFLIQGSLAAAVILYFAAFFHPVPERLRKYLADVWRSLSGQDSPSGSVRSTVVVLACASLYFLGVFTNVVNYWVLAPVHDSVIQEVRDARSERRGDAAFLRYVFPLLLTRGSPSRESYESYLRDDAAWRNKNLTAHESVLPMLRKFLRIIRGVTVASYAILFIALLKSIVGVLIFITCVPWKWAPKSVAMWLYRHFVSYKAYQEGSVEVNTRIMVNETMKRMVAPNLILVVLGLTVFSVAILSYRTIEQEYQLMVTFGAEKASQQRHAPDRE
jgi:hypothetical protein